MNIAVWLTVFIVLLISTCYLLLVAYSAKRETDTAPREAFVECHTGKHGPIPKKNTLACTDLGTEEPILLCPVCYEEAMKTAKINLAKPEKRF